jgi:hypothetical protein
VTETARGWIIPEVAIEAALRAGLQEIAQAITENTIDAYLQRAFFNLPDSERARIKRWFTENELPIVLNWPQTEQQVPCWAIRLASEQGSEFVGNQGGEADFGDGHIGTQSAEPWAATIGIVTYDRNGDNLRWLHHLAKFILAGRRTELSATFPLRFNLAGGDFEFIEKFGGAPMYRREVRVHVEFLQMNASKPTAIGIDAVGVDQASNYANLANI